MESVETLAKKRLEPTWFEEIREKASQLIGKLHILILKN